MARKNARAVNGILLLDKPLEVSSNGILQRVRWLFQAQKAGHTGALDPMASGLLPICFGEATKFSQFLLDTDKTYLVTANFGIRTSTSDVEGEVISEKPVQFSQAELEQALAAFEREQPVTVRADGALVLTDFVELVDRVKALGFEKVALEVRRT